MTCGGPFFLRAGTQGSRPTRLGAGGSVLAVLTNPHSQPVLAYRVILHKGYGINAVVSHKAQACDSMGPTCMAAAGEDTPPPESLSFGEKGLGLGDGVGAAWPMDKLLSAWGPQMGRNKARVLLGVPAVGVHPAPACPTFLPQCSFLAPSSSGGSLTCYFQGCGESTYSENIKNTSQTVDGKNQK